MDYIKGMWVSSVAHATVTCMYVPVPPYYSSHSLANYDYYHYVRQTCHDHFVNNKQISVFTHTARPMRIFMITVTATIINFMEDRTPAI